MTRCVTGLYSTEGKTIRREIVLPKKGETAMAISMPKVLSCTVTDCAYNRNEECHTMGITVGDGDHALCDTYYKNPSKGGTDIIGGVGACKAYECEYNKSFECQAPGINVGRHSGHADCETFSPR